MDMGTVALLVLFFVCPIFATTPNIRFINTIGNGMGRCEWNPNDPLSPDYALTPTIGKYGCGEVSFSPAGDRVSVQSNFFGPLGANLGTITRIYSVNYYSYAINGVYRAAGKVGLHP